MEFDTVFLAGVVNSESPSFYSLKPPVPTRGNDRLIRIQKQNQSQSSKPVFITCEY